MDSFPAHISGPPKTIQFGVDLSQPLTPKFPVVNDPGFNVNDPAAYHPHKDHWGG